MTRGCRIPRAAAAVLATALAACPAAAQDAQYWDNQYGTKAQLLGGLVVGSPSDLSATYYNPGWIALGVDRSLLVTTFAFEYSSLTFKGGLGEDFDPQQDRLTTSPGFLAGRLNVLDLEGWQLAWSYVERMRHRFDADGRRIDPQRLPDQPGESWGFGEALRSTSTDESWYGFSMARRVGERTAFGFTPYLAYRSHEHRLQGAARSLEGGGLDQRIYLVDQLKYSHWRLLAKVGVAFDYEPVTFGVTVTTPGLGLFGGGEVYTHLESSGIDVDGDGMPDEILVADAQRDLSARWRSPFSVAAGLAWRTGRTGWHATVEWFAGLDQRDVVAAAPFVEQTTGETVDWNLSFPQEAVLNFGLGVDHAFNEQVSVYGSFRSDFSTLAPGTPTDVLMGAWDLWHLSAGASYQFLGINLTTGLQYSLGNGTTERFLDLSDPRLGAVGEERRSADARYRRLKLVVGFDLAPLTAEDRE